MNATNSLVPFNHIAYQHSLGYIRSVTLESKQTLQPINLNSVDCVVILYTKICFSNFNDAIFKQKNTTYQKWLYHFMILERIFLCHMIYFFLYDLINLFYANDVTQLTLMFLVTHVFIFFISCFAGMRLNNIKGIKNVAIPKREYLF